MSLGEVRLVQLHADVVARIGEAKCDTQCDALEQACRTLPADMRPSTYGACVDILGADGTLPVAEREFLNRLQRVLCMGPDLALQIENVLLLKNRF